MAANFDLSNLAIQAVCPNNELIYDDKGIPSVMVKIPKMTYAELGLGDSTATHPAFIVNGSEVDAIYISKYQNIVQNGRAYSLPGQDPKTSITGDEAINYCAAKGAGWHLMTRAEWAAVALWCKKNGFLPYGNNNYGKDTRESNYVAIPATKDDTHHALHTATGTGPLTWFHDKTPSGIADLNGNVSEWVGGIRTVYGELQVLVNNNAADSDNSQGTSSTEWKAISGADGSFITPNGSGTTSGSIKLDFISNKLTYSTSKTDTATSYHSCTFENITYDATIGEDAVLLLQALGLLKVDSTSGAYEGDVVYWNSYEAERGFICGGDYGYGGAAGVFSADGRYSFRSIRHGSVGFRSAYVKLPTA